MRFLFWPLFFTCLTVICRPVSSSWASTPNERFPNHFHSIDFAPRPSPLATLISLDDFSPPDHLSTMSKAIISPSVLAVSPSLCRIAPDAHLVSFYLCQSDLGNLTSECKRMMANGCDWLHMGEPRRLVQGFFS